MFHSRLLILEFTLMPHSAEQESYLLTMECQLKSGPENTKSLKLGVAHSQ
jgi:hypothetical protein